LLGLAVTLAEASALCLKMGALKKSRTDGIENSLMEEKVLRRAAVAAAKVFWQTIEVPR
jgi:hypothetical protein